MTYGNLTRSCTIGLLASVFGIVLSTGGFGAFYFVPNAPHLLTTLLSLVGWIPMVTGQSLVLFSRLHLLPLSKRLRKMVLVMIVLNGVIMHGTIIVVSAGSNSGHPGPFLAPYAALERVQIIAFCFQEVILSSIYLWKSFELLSQHQSKDRTEARVRTLMLHLIAVNILVIALDITAIAFEYAGFHAVQVGYKGFVYSVKLKLEVWILNSLANFVKFRRDVGGRLEMPSDIEREWNRTLERTFGSAQMETGTLERRHDDLPNQPVAVVTRTSSPTT